MKTGWLKSKEVQTEATYLRVLSWKSRIQPWSSCFRPHAAHASASWRQTRANQRRRKKATKAGVEDTLQLCTSKLLAVSNYLWMILVSNQIMMFVMPSCLSRYVPCLKYPSLPSAAQLTPGRSLQRICITNPHKGWSVSWTQHFQAKSPINTRRFKTTIHSIYKMIKIFWVFIRYFSLLMSLSETKKRTICVHPQ